MADASPPSSPADPSLLLRAEWLAPMDRPLSSAVVRDGGLVTLGGSIVAAGPWADLRRAYPEAIVHDCGQAVLLPGLVNAHTHLELSHLTPEQVGPRPARFVDWVINLLRRTAPPPVAPDGKSPGDAAGAVAESVRIGVSQCLRFGVTTVGDISRQCGLTRPLLRDGKDGRDGPHSPLRVVSFGEVTAMAQRRGLLEPRLAAAADPSDAGPRLRIGVSPHAPYSVEPEGYRRCRQVADERRLPLATHLAETADEARFLRDHDGPLRELWDFLGAWDEFVPRFDGGPIRLMASLGLLDRPALFAHVNYCDDAELDSLAEAGLAAGPKGRDAPSVVYCPRTHAWFGHPPHRWREMLAKGVNVAVGTDSCASSPDLNLVEDLRLLHRLAPEVPPALLWEMATARAARAVGMGDEVGTLSPGKAADCVVFTVDGADPLGEVLEGDVLPKEIWIAGRRVSA